VKELKNKFLLAIFILFFFGICHVYLSFRLPVDINRGVSFGLYFRGIEWIVSTILAVILYFLVKKFGWGLYLIWVGGVINLVNRILVGYVFDYFNLGWVSNNVGDFLIFIGIILFIFNK